jgi:rod shape-determining protein MreC
VKKPKSKDSGFADTLKGLGTRFALLFIFIITISMLVLGKSDPRIIEKTRAVVIDDLAPVMSILSEPVTAFHRALDWSENVAYVFRENDRLRDENRSLQSWQALAQKLAQENAQFKALLHVQPDQTISVAVARVIADTGGAFVRSIIIDAGKSSGVLEGQPVMDQQGIAGRVVTAGNRSSRVLLITDLNSRVPIKIAESGYNAILAGDNLPMPKIIFLPLGALARVGDHIVTSGHGGIFPPDLAVGKIVSVSKSGEIRVLPAAELGRLNYVRLFSFVPLPNSTPASPGMNDAISTSQDNGTQNNGTQNNGTQGNGSQPANPAPANAAPAGVAPVNPLPSTPSITATPLTPPPAATPRATPNTTAPHATLPPQTTVKPLAPTGLAVPSPSPVHP